MWENSSFRETEHVLRTNKLESPAHSTIWLVSPMGFKSEIRIMKRYGPTPEPWTIERLIELVTEILMQSLVKSVLSLRKDCIHSITF